MSEGESRDYQSIIGSTISYLLEKYNITGTRIGWLMIASIFVDAWDLYSITLFGTAIEKALSAPPVLFGLAAAATQGGAIVGTVTGGWLTDKIGRRKAFLLTMIILTVFAVSQAFVTNIGELIGLRFVLGYPIGMDIAVGYTYIMEYMKKGNREVMGNRWQIAFAAGDLAGALGALILIYLLVPPSIDWRIVLGLGAVWALVILFLRLGIPESVMWLVGQGKFREAKRLAEKTLNDPLSMLPDIDPQIPKVKLRNFIRILRRDSATWRTAVFGWLTNWCQSYEAAPFGLLLAYFLSYYKITSLIGSIEWTALFYTFGLLSGVIWPQLLPRLGHRNFQIIGYTMTTIAISIGLYAVLARNYTVLLYDVPYMGFAMFTPSQSGMTISSMVATPEYRGTATGFAYQFVKWPYFIGYIITPMLMASVGSWINPATALIWAVVGLLGSIFLLPKNLKFGYKEIEK